VSHFLARSESFVQVESTNDVVRGWLADGTPEVCLAVAAEQTRGRGRDGRPWLAPSGAALLLSLGFRPTWLASADTWRLAAIVSLAMARAAELTADLPVGSIRLKWPNDLVVEPTDDADASGTIRKLAGVLGETDGLGTDDPFVVIGLGINTDWPATTFPPGLGASMTSLREVAGGRRVDSETLLEAFLAELQPAIEDLRHRSVFDTVAWADRQVTTGRRIRLERPDGALTGVGAGVDPITGALLFADTALPGRPRSVVVGEVTHVRLAEPTPVRV
jgi:BirA family transcriptional regulator, biotin operon repressor / biotin---[acetyl-CoA-carboxylase] ligase